MDNNEKALGDNRHGTNHYLDKKIGTGLAIQFRPLDNCKGHRTPRVRSSSLDSLLG